MAITEVKRNVSINKSKVEFICPICKTKKSLDVPNSVIAEAKQLTTMSIARGLVCNHQFQAFVDKNFQVRGYQRVDFEFENKSTQENISDSNNHKKEDIDVFEDLILEGNYLEYRPKKIANNRNNILKIQSGYSHKKKMSLEDIYNEFWEFIDENDERFRVFINKDLRRC
ncbi:MAG: hypothetical protein JSV62_04600 [Promethearchaeota archaeon]|nr:MAG: hypothetical protein JSV62_04600 [Candidatus Lokiarchaeota archaeon]